MSSKVPYDSVDEVSSLPTYRSAIQELHAISANTLFVSISKLTPTYAMFLVEMACIMLKPAGAMAFFTRLREIVLSDPAFEALRETSRHCLDILCGEPCPANDNKPLLDVPSAQEQRVIEIMLDRLMPLGFSDVIPLGGRPACVVTRLVLKENSLEKSRFSLFANTQAESLFGYSSKEIECSFDFHKVPEKIHILKESGILPMMSLLK